MTTLLLAMLLAAPSELEGADAPLSDRGGRVRFGVSAQAGVDTSSGALTIDGDLRLGAQLTQWVSVYGLVKAHSALSSVACGLIGFAAEGMLTNHLALAVAMMLGYGSFYGNDPSRSLQFSGVPAEREGSGFKPGFDVKLVLSTGKSRPPRFNRAGMSFGVELLGLLVLEPNLVSPSGAITRGAPLWLFSPKLSVGVDFR